MLHLAKVEADPSQLLGSAVAKLSNQAVNKGGKRTLCHKAPCIDLSFDSASDLHVQTDDIFRFKPSGVATSW